MPPVPNTMIKVKYKGRLIACFRYDFHEYVLKFVQEIARDFLPESKSEDIKIEMPKI